MIEVDQKKAIQGLNDNFLESAGKKLVEELVYHFLFTRGDTLGGRMRNLAGTVGERKLTKAISATLSISGRSLILVSIMVEEAVVK
ncbi:MAG: hypothetical protein JXA21_28055 [Anaerolineae bacterium]|nr:hypothetical protein [Anaerolineae bacterium]